MKGFWPITVDPEAPASPCLGFLLYRARSMAGRFLQQYRKKRLAEMRQAARISRFGSVVPISGSDFVREVSQAPPDAWVVVILYKDGIPES